jgi:hypothetical protein
MKTCGKRYRNLAKIVLSRKETIGMDLGKKEKR